MSTDPQNYDPRYISISAIPIDGEGSYSVDQKRAALFRAEPRFESDVNGGEPIPADEVTQLHEVAVATLATFELTRSAVSPSSATLGDLADDGDTRQNYAESYWEDYLELIDDINGTSKEHGEESVYYGSTSSTTDSIATNTRDGERMEYRYPYERDVRWPDE